VTRPLDREAATYFAGPLDLAQRDVPKDDSQRRKKKARNK
jgi:hypothetical protein